MNRLYRISDFCHAIDVSSNVIALYNSLTLGVMFLNKDIAELIKFSPGNIIDFKKALIKENEKDKIISALLERRLIFPLGERADLEDYLRINQLLKEPGYSILYLITTEACNLKCRYCYIEGQIPEGYKFSMMDFKIAKKAIDFFAANLRKDIKEPSIIFYGGEPLLNKEVIFLALEYIDKLKSNLVLPDGLKVIINTNSTLIDAGFAKKISNYKVEIAVSLDGKQEMHDKMRIYHDNKGSYNDVINACKQLKNAGVLFGFSLTITKVNIYHLKEIITWLKNEFQINSIGFNIVIDRSQEIIGMTENEYAELIAEKLIECFEFCRQNGIYEDRIMRKVDAFVDGYPYLYDCGAPGDQIVVLPNDKVGTCQAYCGSGKNFVPFEEFSKNPQHPLWEEWRYRSPIFQQQCYNCIALAICGGGCPYNAELKNGSIWELDNVFCVHAKKTITYLIKDLYQKSASP